MYKEFFYRLNKSLKNKSILSRVVPITTRCLGKKFLIYNGRTYKTVFINPLRLGGKIGEYSFTRMRTIHFKKKKKKK